MKKISIGIVVGMLVITALILTSGIALGAVQINGTEPNISKNEIADTSITGQTNGTGMVTKTNETDGTNVTDTAVVPTETVEGDNAAIVPELPGDEPYSSEDEDVLDTGAESEQTVASTPKEGPGFGSVIAIAMILSAIYIFRSKRK